ncbi:MAG: DASS family sodium-coupled anion symporter [Bacteroidia bacterium]|nr:DASS family sodium-coupled anion symporter [Bacteroidia bacterium]
MTKSFFSSYNPIQLSGLVMGPALFFITLFSGGPEGMPEPALGVLATTLWIAVWWITEAIPIEVTSVLPILLLPAAGGGLSVSEAATSYGHPLVFLYFGGFIIALAIERWNLHQRIALNIIYRVGTNLPRLVLGFMISTSFISMWISNTATALMMLPIGLAVVTQLSQNTSDNPVVVYNFARPLMLSIAYASSIGGMATLIGTPTNLVFVGVVKEAFRQEITFFQWLMIGLPFSIITLILCWWLLTHVLFKLDRLPYGEGRETVKEQLRSLGKMTTEEKMVTAIFVFTAFLWISRSFLFTKIFPMLDDTLIALMGASLLFILPAPNRQGQRLMNWSHAVRLPWGVLLLFGGGLAIAAGFEKSGLATWIGNQMTLLQGVGLILIIAAVTTLVNFLTEVTSNMATASMIMPILASLAMAMGIHPYSLMVPAILAASCAFMLPVATPPNAVVFGSGMIRMMDMVRAGFWMNILTIILITLYLYLILPLFWGIDLQSFPENFRIK